MLLRLLWASGRWPAWVHLHSEAFALMGSSQAEVLPLVPHRRAGLALGRVGTVPPVLRCRPKEPLPHWKDGAVLSVLLAGSCRAPPWAAVPAEIRTRRLVLHSAGLWLLQLQPARRNRFCHCLRALKSLTCALYYGLKKPGKSVPWQSLSTMHVTAAYSAN